MTKKKLFAVGVSILLCLSLVPLTAMPAAAKQVVMVVKGTVAKTAWDTLGIFQDGSGIGGKPFTLTITFDAPPLVIEPGNKCPASLLNGNSANPAKAVLTIGSRSYVFGTKPESQWDAYRDTAPGCPQLRGVGFHVMEGSMPTTSNLWLGVEGHAGEALGSGPSWQSSIPSTKIVGVRGSFIISRPGDPTHGAGGGLNPETVSVSSGNGSGIARAGDTDGSVGVQEAAEPHVDATVEKARQQAGGGIVITVTGKVGMGHDDYGIFKVGRDLKGQNFTLVFTFTKVAQHGSHLCDDKSGGASYFGTAKTPARAVLTIGNGSFTFGGAPDSTWAVSRGIPSECTDDEIEMNVKEGIYPQVTLLQVKLQAPPGGMPLNTTIDWNSPLSSSNLNKSPLLSSFGISHPNDYEHSDHGVLIPESVTIGGGDAGGASSKAEAADESNGSPAESATKQGNGNPAVSDGSSTPPTPQQSLKDTVRKVVGRWLPKIAVPNQ